MSAAERDPVLDRHYETAVESRAKPRLEPPISDGGRSLASTTCFPAL
jgi:hypothetical protein